MDKLQAYTTARAEIDAILQGEHLAMVKMVTINCILKKHFPYFYWVGFYLVHDGGLIVGPYQGTLGCLHISFDRGVCGRAAQKRATQIVDDVHADAAHIACDPATNSEIVVPVVDENGQLHAVLDIDSTEIASFDALDKAQLEAIIQRHFAQATWSINQTSSTQ